MSRPKQQHWVPRFYLSCFSNGKAEKSTNPQVHVLDRSIAEPKPFSTSVRNVCGQRYMYSPEIGNGERDFEFEEFLGRIEVEIADLFRDAEPEHLESVISDNRRQLGKFMAALVLRNKYHLDLVKSVMVLRDKLSGPPAEKEFRRSVRLANHEVEEEQVFDLHDAKRHFVQSSTYSLPKVTETLLSLAWTLIVCDAKCFITSDRPVTSVHPKVRGPGPATEGAKTFFSITPKMCLFMRKESNVPVFNRVDVAKSISAEINSLIRDFSMRFVFASGESHFESIEK